MTTRFPFSLIAILFFCLIGIPLTISPQAHAALPENYSYLSAKEKQEILWENANQDLYEKVPTHPLSFFQKVRQFFTNETAHPLSDERSNGIKRITHRYSSVAKVKFIGNRIASYSDSFRTEAPGILRLSLAFARTHPEKDPFIPGMALKLLADGAEHSLNFFAVESSGGQVIEGTQEPDRNFFANDLSTALVAPRVYSNRSDRFFFKLMGWISSPSEPLFLTQTSDSQTPASKKLLFKPSLDVTFLIDPHSQEDFRTDLAQVPAGKTLYEVYEQNPNQDDETRLGSLILESSFIASAYGDNQLFFK